MEPLTAKIVMNEQREALVKEAEEAVQVRNISLSIWASDNDSSRNMFARTLTHIDNDFCQHQIGLFFMDFVR